MPADPFTVDDVLAAIRRHLAARHTCVLATSRENAPWAASSFYVARDLDLYVCQGRTARTLANMRANPQAAFAVDDRRAEAWLQGAGTITPISPEEDGWARAALTRAAPEFTHHFANPDQPVLCIRPNELTFADRRGGIYPRRHLLLRDGAWVFAS